MQIPKPPHSNCLPKKDVRSVIVGLLDLDDYSAKITSELRNEVSVHKGSKLSKAEHLDWVDTVSTFLPLSCSKGEKRRSREH